MIISIPDYGQVEVPGDLPIGQDFPWTNAKVQLGVEAACRHPQVLHHILNMFGVMSGIEIDGVPLLRYIISKAYCGALELELEEFKNDNHLSQEALGLMDQLIDEVKKGF